MRRLSSFTKDTKRWRQLVRKNKGPYGTAIARFASLWANLMEKKMAKGAKLNKSIVSSAIHEAANVESVSGFMAGCAFDALVEVWKYGKQLKLLRKKIDL